MSQVMRLFLASGLAIVAASVLLPVDLRVRTTVLCTVVAVVAVGWLAYEPLAGDSASVSAAAPGGGPAVASRRASASVSAAPDPLDPALYTLRTLPTSRTAATTDGGTAVKNLSVREGGRVLSAVLRAARAGERHGNGASGRRALAVLEDFYARYHRALLDGSAGGPELAARTLGVLSDSRVEALNAIHELSMCLPPSRKGVVLRAAEAVRVDTLRCERMLAARHAPSLSPSLAVAADVWCHAPLPRALVPSTLVSGPGGADGGLRLH